MAKISIMCEIEVGHLLPVIGLAEALRDEGHAIIFLIIKDMEKYLKETDFSYRIIFPTIYPEGSIKAIEELRKSGKDDKQKKQLLPMLQGELDNIFKDEPPELLLLDYSLCFEALIIHYMYGIKQLLFNTFLREVEYPPEAICVGSFMNLSGQAPTALLDLVEKKNNGTPMNLKEIIYPVTLIPELILCPKEFDLPTKNYGKQIVHHIGPCVRKLNNASSNDSLFSDYQWKIFVSFGSQISLYVKETSAVIQELIEVMKLEQFQNTEMIIATGGQLILSDEEQIPSNVKLKDWVDQTKVINESDLVITHGGLGGIKECIFVGKPMLVIPFTRDQPANAKLIEMHKLGKKIDWETINNSTLTESISELLKSNEFPKHLAKMQKIFHDYNKQNLGSTFIKDYLNL